MQLTTQPTSRGRAVGEGDPQPAAGAAASRRATSPVDVAQPAGGRAARAATAARGRHPVAEHVPAAGVGRRGTRRGRPRDSRCHSSLTRKRSPSTAGRQSPVAGPHLAPGARRRWPASPARVGAPVGDVGDRGQLELVGVRARAAGRCARRRARGGRHGRRAGSADRTTSTMVRPVPTTSTSPAPTRSRRTTSSAPGAHGSGTKNGEPARPRRRPVVTRGRQTGGDDHRIGGQRRARRPSSTAAPPAWRRTPTRAGADVAQRGGGGGQVEGVGERLVEVAARTDDAARRFRARPRWRAPAGPPGHEVARVLAAVRSCPRPAR